MAVTVDADTVAYGVGALVTENLTAGETITRGLPVYKKASDGKYWTADVTSAETANVAGIAVTGAAADGVFSVLTKGDLLATYTTATIGLHAELGSGGGFAAAGERDTAGSGFITPLGVFTTTGTLNVLINATGVEAS